LHTDDLQKDDADLDLGSEAGEAGPELECTEANEDDDDSDSDYVPEGKEKAAKSEQVSSEDEDDDEDRAEAAYAPIQIEEGPESDFWEVEGTDGTITRHPKPKLTAEEAANEEEQIIESVKKDKLHSYAMKRFEKRVAGIIRKTVCLSRNRHCRFAATNSHLNREPIAGSVGKNSTLRRTTNSRVVKLWT
jgi:hypothetical protein